MRRTPLWNHVKRRSRKTVKVLLKTLRMSCQRWMILQQLPPILPLYLRLVLKLQHHRSQLNDIIVLQQVRLLDLVAVDLSAIHGVVVSEQKPCIHRELYSIKSYPAADLTMLPCSFPINGHCSTIPRSSLRPMVVSSESRSNRCSAPFSD